MAINVLRFLLGLVGVGGSSGSGPAAIAWDPSFKAAAINLSAGNTVAVDTGGGNSVLGITPRSAGKFNFRVKRNGTTDSVSGTGVAPQTATLGSYTGGSAGSIGYMADGNIRSNTSVVASALATYTTNDIIDVWVDFTAGKVWFGKNGTSVSGDPVAGTGGFAISGTLRPSASSGPTGQSYTILSGIATAGYSTWG